MGTALACHPSLAHRMRGLALPPSAIGDMVNSEPAALPRLRAADESLRAQRNADVTEGRRPNHRGRSALRLVDAVVVVGEVLAFAQRSVSGAGVCGLLVPPGPGRNGIDTVTAAVTEGTKDEGQGDDTEASESAASLGGEALSRSELRLRMRCFLGVFLVDG